MTPSANRSLRGSLRIALHLLGRHVGPGADRHRELLGQQVGQLLVARQAEVDQHRLAVVAQDDVAGLQVEVDDVLAVQVVQRDRDLDADLDDLVERQRRLVEARPQRVARR